MSKRDLVLEDHTLVVRKIRVTMHSTGYFFDSDTRSGNHASIYLVMGDGTSVQLNMIKAGNTHIMGTLERLHCPYADSNSSVHNVDLLAMDGLTVGHVVQLIEQKGRDNFKLARSGVGCRFWVKTVIEDLDAAGYIHPSSPARAAQAYNDLQYNYTKKKAPEFEAIVPGTFV